MKILVTGGAGFIGTNLCNELRSRGYSVISCDVYNTELDDYRRCDVGKYRQKEKVFEEYGLFDNYTRKLLSDEGLFFTSENAQLRNRKAIKCTSHQRNV